MAEQRSGQWAVGSGLQQFGLGCVFLLSNGILSDLVQSRHFGADIVG